MGNNLTGQTIASTYEQLVQISGSRLTDGTGSNINSLTVTVSNANNAISASHAVNADNAISASYAVVTDTAVSASYAANATSASFASVATSASYAANSTSASYAVASTSASHAVSADSALTATSSSYATNALSASYAVNSTSASQAENANTATSASFATTSTSASYAATSTSASHAVNADASLTATSASFADTSTSSSYSAFALTASFALNAAGGAADTGSLLRTASISDATITFTKGDASTFNIVVNNVVNATSASLAANATTASYALVATSASHADNADSSTSASYATNALSASFASTIPSNLNFTASSALINGNLNVTGTASFGFVETITGSAIIINEEFIILNAQTPAAPFAGIVVYDTGSASTASLEWNGNTDNWIVVEEQGASAMILTGLTGSKGSEVAPALNKLLKGTGNHTVADSTITDDGTLVTIDANVSASGYISSSQFVGPLEGNASTATSASYAATATSASHAVNATSASHAVNADTSISSSYATNALSSSFATTASFALNADPFPYTGNVGITGDINLTGSYNRLSGSFSGSAIDNITDIYTSTAKVNHVISLTQAEFNSISASADQNTLYYITDAPSFVTSASYADFALSSSYAFNATTASFATSATSASYALNSTSASYALNSTSASYAVNATSASYAFNATTASYALGPVTLGSNTFTGDQIISGADLILSGSAKSEVKALSISSNTASLDCTAGNFFALTLVDGANTFVNPSNIQAGQTINLSVVNGVTGTGTISFATSVLQPSGSVYTATTGSDVLDVVTLISFDNANLLLSAVKNFV